MEASATYRYMRISPQKARLVVDLIRGTLERLAEEGKLRDVRPTVATFALLGILNWISRWYRPDGKITAQEAVESLVSLGLNAVLRSETRKLPAMLSRL